MLGGYRPELLYRHWSRHERPYVIIYSFSASTSMYVTTSAAPLEASFRPRFLDGSAPMPTIATLPLRNKNVLYAQMFRRMLHMIVRKCRNEKVRMIVPILIPYLHPLPGLLRRLLEILRQQLPLLIEIVARPNIDQDIRLPLELLQQFRRIMLMPFTLVLLPKVPSESLLPPRTIHRIRNRRKSTHALVLARVLQEQRESSMPAHRVPCNAHPTPVQLLEFLKQRAGQLVGDIAVHPVAVFPGLGGRVDVEAGARAEVVAVVFAFEVEAAGRGVWEDDGDAAFRGHVLEEALLGAIVACAGQAREVDEKGGGFGSGGGGWQVEVQFHLAGGAFGLDGEAVSNVCVR